MSASHNPAGPNEDWGIKFNYNSGEPAPERITDAIFGYTQKISELRMAEFEEVDLSQLGTTRFGSFEVRVGWKRPGSQRPRPVQRQWLFRWCPGALHKVL